MPQKYKAIKKELVNFGFIPLNRTNLLPANTIPNQEINIPFLLERQIELKIKRLDQVHPEVSGNKFFKLKYNLEQAKKEKKTGLLTFGGAYSNHIQATSAAAKAAGFSCIGVIRGEPKTSLNPTLTEANANGMHLHYISREQYRQKESPDFLNELRGKFGDFYLIPEGGTNGPAITGTSEILQPEDVGFDYIACSIGTGGTFCGLLAGSKKQQKLMGFSSLKGNFILHDIEKYIAEYSIPYSSKYLIYTNYHFGGYAKFKPELIRFIHGFYSQTGIPLDPVYTGKMLFGLFEEIKSGKFPPGSKILAIHTGGLQGIRGFNERFGENLSEK